MMMQVEQAMGQSRYGALAAALRGHIVAGDWPPGMALPAEQALAAEHGVALGTMRQALALLVQQGLVERRHGKGTFVRAGLAGAPMLRFFRFGGGTGEVPSSRILVRQDVSRDLASLLMDDFRDALAHLDRHPVSVPMTKEESAGFNHL